MMMGMEEGDAYLPIPEQGAFAYFVTHAGNESFSNLPAAGGTVMVDVVVATADALQAWEVWPAVEAGNVINIDATGWSQQAELLAWAGLSSQQLPSYYACEQLDWMVLDAQDRVVCRSSANNAACVNRLLEPGASGYTASGLDMLHGAINTPEGSYFTTASPLAALTCTTLDSGAVRVATLTLHVAGAAGTYHLSVANGSYYSVATTQQQPMQPGPVFEIQVSGE